MTRVLLALILLLALPVILPSPAALADCGESPGGNLTINSSCSFAAPCTSATTTGCNVNGLDNGSLTVGSTGALTINAGQSIYLNPGQSLSITPGGYVNIGKSGNTTGSLSFGYLWVPGSGSTITGSAESTTSTTSAPGSGYIRRSAASSMYCAAAQSCPTACGYAGGTVPAGAAADGTCATTTCAATASCCAANYGQACSACNNCGTCNSGTYLCNGTCSVSAPANQTTYTYYQDADGDGYGNPNVTTTSCSSTPPAGYVTNNTDCYDSNARAHPGQTSWFVQNRGDGSFDYDCSGATETYTGAEKVASYFNRPNQSCTYGVCTCSATSNYNFTIGAVSSADCGTNPAQSLTPWTSYFGNCPVGANMWFGPTEISAAAAAPYVGSIIYNNYDCNTWNGWGGPSNTEACTGTVWQPNSMAVGNQDLYFLNADGSDYTGATNGGCGNHCSQAMPLGCH